MSATIVLTFIVGNLILKNAFDRLRPCQIDETIHLIVKIPFDSSFPSRTYDEWNHKCGFTYVYR